MIEMRKVFDYESCRVVLMPASEVEGMVEINGLWVDGFHFDFGQGVEAVADPLQKLVDELWPYEPHNRTFGFHKRMWLSLSDREHADSLAAILNAPVDIGVTVEDVEDDGEWEFRVSWPREVLHEIYRRWRAWKKENVEE
jgi:hypothetical protein